MDEPKQYRIATMDYDYQVENQENWVKTFDSLDEAINAALKQHTDLDPLTSGQPIVPGANHQIYTFITGDVDGMDIVWLFHEGKVYKDLEAQVLFDMLSGEECA